MKSTSSSDVLLPTRWLIRSDLQRVVDIDYESFPVVWTEENFSTALRSRNTIGMVIDVDDRVEGYMIYELHKSTLIITRMAVAENCRLQGVGRSLVHRLISKLSPDRRNTVAVFVRESNLTAQVFFRSLGFRANKILYEYFEDPAEDAYRMVYRINADSMGS